MMRSVVTGAGAAAMVSLAAGLLGATPPDAFVFLAPDVVIGQDDRAMLDRGETLVRVLPGRDGFLAVSAIVRVDATAERVVWWMSEVERLQKGKYVPEIGRFSTPPRLSDLDGLTIDPGDLKALRACVPGDCDVKLSDLEIRRLRTIGDPAGQEAAFRNVLLTRAADYLREGDASALPYHDHKTPVAPADALQSILHRLDFFSRRFACYADYLRGYPAVADQHVQQSFLYWSKETLGMKPIVSITHFSAAWLDTPGGPQAIVVSKQVYATHYRNGSLTMTAIVADGESRYLVYINRSQIDAFRGLFGGFVRRAVERRVLAEVPEVLRDVRRRMEAVETVAPR
jgi:hypothetical protein